MWDLEGGKDTAMRGRSHETGPEGPREESLDDQKGPEGRPKGTQEYPAGRQVTHNHRLLTSFWAGRLFGGPFRYDVSKPMK